MKQSIYLLLIILTFACNKKGAPASSTHGKASDPSATISMSTMNADILSLVNQYRNSKKLPALQMNTAASDAALQHSRDMASNKVPFGHNGFSSRISKIESKIGPVKMAGENVAYGKMTAKEVVDGWIHSKVHRENIEGKYNQIGIGVAKSSNGTIFYTQIFIQN